MKEERKKIKSLKAMVFLYAVASICKSSRSYSKVAAAASKQASRFRGMRFIGALILSYRFIVVNSTKMAGLRALGREAQLLLLGPVVMMQIKNRISLRKGKNIEGNLLVVI